MRSLKISSLAVLSCGLLLSFSGRSAVANTINGTLYCNVGSAVASNTPAPGATISSGTVCATFQASTINFNSTGNGDNTIGAFLNSGGSILGSVQYVNGFSQTSNLDYSVFLFSGTGYFVNGQQYAATHDDGTVMAVNGVTVINAPAPTSAVTSTFVWTGATGNYAFQYDFSEVQGATEYVSNAANSPVPEPSSLVLLGSGMCCAAGLARRQFRTV